MTTGGPGYGTTTLEFFIYQQAFTEGNFGIAATAGFVPHVPPARLAWLLNPTCSRSDDFERASLAVASPGAALLAPRAARGLI